MKRSAAALAALLPAVVALAQAPRPDDCEAPSEYKVIEQCGWAESEKLEVQLNTEYGKLMSVVRIKRTDVVDMGRSQKAWLAYRDASCAYWSSRVRYQVPWCRVELTRARIKQLLHMRECEQEGGGKC